MKLFGTVNSFDIDKGVGSIKPETGGDNLAFERSAMSWDSKATPPKTGQRLSYDLGTDSASKPRALHLERI